MGGYSVSGSLTVGSKNASATTSTGNSNGGCKIAVSCYYAMLLREDTNYENKFRIDRRIRYDLDKKETSYIMESYDNVMPSALSFFDNKIYTSYSTLEIVDDIAKVGEFSTISFLMGASEQHIFYFNQTFDGDDAGKQIYYADKSGIESGKMEFELLIDISNDSSSGYLTNF